MRTSIEIALAWSFILDYSLIENRILVGFEDMWGNGNLKKEHGFRMMYVGTKKKTINKEGQYEFCLS